ncbi:vWA domain-containing protein [Roseburia inulinivorans]|uniref:hypothetical protein n=1 Tax=Roseburia inulinivorans TaxID=360807 RepID=UPI001D158293|nr:hypothetical protein [Roseburia inulinivorans]MCC3342598.1 hypothetical protein [Roseburia inulinivorans DSM 16841]
MALLVYNTEIVYEEDFGNINQKTRHALETVELQGYTTPAVALETAADMFDSAAADKRVVFISDGEISLRDQSKTETAIRQFEIWWIRYAEKGIKIDMFAIPMIRRRMRFLWNESDVRRAVYSRRKTRRLKKSLQNICSRRYR